MIGARSPSIFPTSSEPDGPLIGAPLAKETALTPLALYPKVILLQRLSLKSLGQGESMKRTFHQR